jgi:hypothetical protein
VLRSTERSVDIADPQEAPSVEQRFTEPAGEIEPLGTDRFHDAPYCPPQAMQSHILSCVVLVAVWFLALWAEDKEEQYHFEIKEEMAHPTRFERVTFAFGAWPVGFAKTIRFYPNVLYSTEIQKEI